MVEDILKKDGLSFALLRKLSFRTRLEENLAQAISCLDEAFLTEELKNIVVWYDSSDILSGLPIDYRIKSLQAILRKYQRASIISMATDITRSRFNIIPTMTVR